LNKQEIKHPLKSTCLIMYKTNVCLLIQLLNKINKFYITKHCLIL